MTDLLGLGRWDGETGRSVAALAREADKIHRDLAMMLGNKWGVSGAPIDPALPYAPAGDLGIRTFDPDTALSLAHARYGVPSNTFFHTYRIEPRR